MNEARLRQALDVAGVGVADHDHLTGNLWWSPRMRTILGVADDVSGSTINHLLSIVHPDDRDTTMTALTGSLNPSGNGELEIEHRLLRRDGALRGVSVHARTSFEGTRRSRRPERTVGTMLDITVRRQAETAAHATHQQREDLIASIDGTGGHIDVESEVDRGTVFAFLQKPFSPSALAHKVREVLDAPGRATRSQSDINA